MFLFDCTFKLISTDIWFFPKLSKCYEVFSGNNEVETLEWAIVEKV